MSEQPALDRAYGDHPARFKLLATVLDAPDRTFNLRELADEAGVSEWAAHEHKTFLLKHDFLETTPTHRGYTGYQLADTEIAQVARQFHELHEDQFQEVDNSTEAIQDFYG